MKRTKIIKITMCVCTALAVATLVSCKKVPVTMEDGTVKKVSVRTLRNQDFNAVVEYITQGYAPYDDAVKQGFDIKKARRTLKWRYIECRLNHIFINRKHEYHYENGIDDSAMRYAIIRALMASPVKDGHLSVYASDTGGFIHQKCYASFSDLIFEKDGEKYKVVSSKSENIVPGMVYTGDEENLLRFSKDGKDFYRFGTITEYYSQKAEVSLDGKNYEVPLKTTYENYKRNDFSYNVNETADSVYISVSDFDLALEDNDMFKEIRDRYKEFIEKVMKAASDSNKKNIILDLRGNSGGYRDYANQLIGAMFYGDNEGAARQFESIASQYAYGQLTLDSVVTVKASYDRVMASDAYDQYDKKEMKEKYEYALKNNRRMWAGLDKPVLSEIPLLNNSKFKGKLYILLDSFTASAAEDCIAISYVEDKEKVVLVGLNSTGCIDFGGVNHYCLPNSKVVLNFVTTDLRRIPMLAQNPHWHGDTKGFYPDYWATNDELLDTLVSLTGDEALRITLKGLNKGQVE